jgi:hypothetical protein
MSSLKTKSSSRSNTLAAHLTRLRAPAVHGVYAPVHDVAAAAVIIRIVVRIVIIGVVVPVRPVAIAPPIALASELVIVISPNDGAGTKTAESATIVNDGGPGPKLWKPSLNPPPWKPPPPKPPPWPPPPPPPPPRASATVGAARPTAATASAIIAFRNISFLHPRSSAHSEPARSDRKRRLLSARTSWPFNSARSLLRNLSRSFQKNL